MFSVCVCVCVCLTRGWLTNHLEARCRLENYPLSSLPFLQLLLVPLVNLWTLTSRRWRGCVTPGPCVCALSKRRGRGLSSGGRELSLADLRSSSSLIDPVPTETASIFLQLSVPSFPRPLSQLRPCCHLAQWLTLGKYSLQCVTGVSLSQHCTETTH